MLTPAWLLLAGFYAAVRLLLPAGIRFLSRHGVTEVNYQGTSIPTAAGLLIWAWTLGTEILCFFLSPDGIENGLELAKFAAATTMVTAACFIDDRFGDKSVKGVAGHWRAWTRGRTLTTGWLKAAAISAGALLILEPGGFVQGIRQTLLLLLSAHAFNLLDVRPGRALKAFLPGMAVLLPLGLSRGNGFAWNDGHLMWAAFYAAGGLALFPHDVKARVMLGDTGANLLGFVFGCAVVWFMGPEAELTVLTLLIGLHAWAWNRSLSRLIDGNRFLRWVDRAGRKRA